MGSRDVHHRSVFSVALSFALVVAACTAPAIPEGRLVCDGHDDCPADFACGTDGLCYRAEASGGGTGGGTGGGGGPDGGTPCAPAGDYVESLVDTNDSTVSGAPEATGIELTTAWQTIAGCIEPNASSHASKTDRDEFAFTVPAGTTVWADFHIVRDPAQTSTFVAEVQFAATSLPLVSNIGIDQYPTPILLEPGDYKLVVIDVDPDSITGPYGYAIAMRMVTCQPPGTPSYGEQADGADSRGNDVFTVSYVNPGTTNVTPTSATDAPEASGVILEPGTPFRFYGSLALVASDADAYLDRDAFRISLSANARALVLQFALSSPDLVDLVLVEESDISEAGLRTASLGAQSPFGFQTLAASLSPNASYLFWVGKVDRTDANDVAVNYDVTVCALGF